MTNSTKSSLIYKIAEFVESTAIELKSIRILDKKSAILYYKETHESNYSARSQKCG